MSAICAILVLLSLIGVAVSVIGMIRKKPRAKVSLLVCVAVFIASVLLMPSAPADSGGSASGGEPAAVSAPAPLPAESEPAAPVESQPDETEPDAEVDSGVLMSAQVFTADVLNGFETEVIGQRAYVIVTKEALSDVTEEEYSQFVNERVKDSGYNWWSIICDDGTGICFPGSMYYVGDYGKIDSDGSILESYGTIMINDDGGYTYEQVE